MTPIFSFIFIRKENEKGLAINDVYVDNIKIIVNLGELSKAIDCLKKWFEMNDLWKFCLGLWIKYFKNEICFSIKKIV